MRTRKFLKFVSKTVTHNRVDHVESTKKKQKNAEMMV